MSNFIRSHVPLLCTIMVLLCACGPDTPPATPTEEGPVPTSTSLPVTPTPDCQTTKYNNFDIQHIGGLSFAAQEWVQVYYEPLPPEIEQLLLESHNSPPPTPNLLSLQDAARQVPFPIDLPTWMPPGFSLAELETTLSMSPQFPSMFPLPRENYEWLAVRIRYLDPLQGERIDYMIAYPPSGSIPYGAGSLAEVAIAEHPGALIRSQWLQEDIRNSHWETGKLALHWVVGDLGYYLGSHERALSAEALLRMANSIEFSD